MQPIIAKVRKTTDRRWSPVAATRDLPTIAFFRAGALLRRSVPVPGILAAHRPTRKEADISGGPTALTPTPIRPYASSHADTSPP